MEGRRSEEIRKGTWKAEEDEVLINHVNQYGPRDWSSLRTKGLLQRTGKSCRLRWVNKLRPNLKHGCKFSAEEARVVIELQSEFGNKWARIATFLPGRTDNDVKNYWSSKQKRLAKMLRTSSTAITHGHGSPSISNSPTFEAPIFGASSSAIASSSSSSSSSSSPYVENHGSTNMETVPPLPHLINPKFDGCNANLAHQVEQPQPHLVSFSEIPPPQSQQQMATAEEDSCCLFGASHSPNYEFGTGAECLPIGPMFFDPVGASNFMNEDRDMVNPAALQNFFDDFPIEMYDPIELLPSPSK